MYDNNLIYYKICILVNIINSIIHINLYTIKSIICNLYSYIYIYLTVLFYDVVVV